MVLLEAPTDDGRKDLAPEIVRCPRGEELKMLADEVPLEVSLNM